MKIDLAVCFQIVYFCAWGSVFAPPLSRLHDFSGRICTGDVKYMKTAGELFSEKLTCESCIRLISEAHDHINIFLTNCLRVRFAPGGM